MENLTGNPINTPIVPETKINDSFPKINHQKIYLTLLIVILVLSIFSLYFFIINKNKKIPFSPISISTPTPIIIIDNNQLPDQFKNLFDQIDIKIKNNSDFLPPTIDTKIGFE